MKDDKKSIVAKCSMEHQIFPGGGTFKVHYKDKEIALADVHFHDGFAKIKKLVVEPEYRGMGVGKKLVEGIISWCKKKKIKAITVHASSGIDKEMIDLGISKGLTQSELVQFYKKRGFSEEKDDYLRMNLQRFTLFKKKDPFWD